MGAGVILLLVGAGTAYRLNQPAVGTGEPEGTRVTEDFEGVRDSEQLARAATGPGASTAAITATIPVYAGDGGPPLNLLALIPEGASTASTQLHYCLPAALLPTQGRLQDDRGNALEFTAVTWERTTGMVLLAGPAPDPSPEGFSPLNIGAIRQVSDADDLWALTNRGERLDDLRVVDRGIPMGFGTVLPTGAVVLDADQRALAYMTRMGGYPLHPLASWLQSGSTRPLDALQEEVRANTPALILVDAQQRLESADADLASVEEALTLLAHGQALARDRVTLESLDELLRFGHLQRIRLLSAIDGSRALNQALESLALFGTHPRIHNDAILLALDVGNPDTALDLFGSLRAQDPAMATQMERLVTRKLRTVIAAWLRGSQDQAALRLLERSVFIFPTDAELRLLYAEALEQFQNSPAAQIQAEEAVRLDPSLGSRANRFLTVRTRGQRSGTRLVIPFNSRRNQILTKGSAGRFELEFIIDTGATYTTIPTRIARSLGLGGTGQPIQVQTASGTIRAEQVVVPSITIGGRIEVRNVTAVVLDLPGTLDGRGLLGLNVLGRLNMQIDSERSQLILTSGRSRRRRR